MRNDALAQAVLDHIREHPEEWSQDAFLCGTTACFAGHAVLLGLAGVEGDNFEERRGSFRAWQTGRNRTLWQAGRTLPDSGRSLRILAQNLLGWTKEEADHVFYNFTKQYSALERSVRQVTDGMFDVWYGTVA